MPTAVPSHEPEEGDSPSSGRAPSSVTTKAPDGAGSSVAGREPKTSSRWGFLTELPGLMIISLVLALLIKTFVFQAFYIPSGSMLPTLEVGDRVLVNKVVYHLHSPRRGDVIVFEDPDPAAQPDRSPLSGFWHWLTEGLGVSASAERDFIKRVIALPGETIEIDRGRVLVDGRELKDEPYLNELADMSDFPPHTVPADSVFVMGDNRTSSSDSRSSLGDIPHDRIIGRAFVIIWPPSRLRWLPGADYSLVPAPP
jgi:signal peptidase I